MAQVSQIYFSKKVAPSTLSLSPITLLSPRGRQQSRRQGGLSPLSCHHVRGGDRGSQRLSDLLKSAQSMSDETRTKTLGSLPKLILFLCQAP